MAISQDELQIIVNSVLSALNTNSRTIDQLSGVDTLLDTDSFEVGGGKKISFPALKKVLTEAEFGKLKHWLGLEGDDERNWYGNVTLGTILAALRDYVGMNGWTDKADKSLRALVKMLADWTEMPAELEDQTVLDAAVDKVKKTIIEQEVSEKTNMIPSSKAVRDAIKGSINSVKDFEVKTDLSGVLSIEDKIQYMGWLDSSDRIINYQDSKFIVFALKGNDKLSIQKKSSADNMYAMIVKEFDFNYTMPYTVSYAQGETGRIFNKSVDKIVGSDARFLLVATYNSNLGDITPDSIKINGVEANLRKAVENLFNPKEDSFDAEKAVGDLKDEVERRFNELDPKFEEMTGHVDGSLKVMKYGSSAYIAIPVKGGDHLYIPKQPASKGTAAFAIVKDFPYNPTIPYTFMLASGETGVRMYLNANVTDLTIPEDANYLLVRAKYQDGSDNLPTAILINGWDVLKPLKNRLEDMSEKISDLSSYIPLEKFRQSEKMNVLEVFDPQGKGGTQGMFTMEGKLYSCSVDTLYLPDESAFYSSGKRIKMKAGHMNDIDYNVVTDTLLTAGLNNSEDTMTLLLLPGAKGRISAGTDIERDEFTSIFIEGYKDDFFIVGSCFGERADIVYLLLIDAAKDFNSEKKKLLKVRLGMKNNIEYDGTYSIMKEENFPYILEIQGSKYRNGKLYIGTDSYIGTGSTLHAGITVVDLSTMQTTEYLSYLNEADKTIRYESEGVSFIGDDLWHLLIDHSNGNKAWLRKYNITNL